MPPDEALKVLNLQKTDLKNPTRILEVRERLQPQTKSVFACLLACLLAWLAGWLVALLQEGQGF
jgi:hypothetical protein